MIQNINEKEFVNEFGEQYYTELIKNIVSRLRDSGIVEKTDQDQVTDITIYPFIDDKYLVVKSTVNKNVEPVDFGITRLLICDTEEEATNSLLDLGNELKDNSIVKTREYIKH